MNGYIEAWNYTLDQYLSKCTYFQALVPAVSIHLRKSISAMCFSHLTCVFYFLLYIKECKQWIFKYPTKISDIQFISDIKRCSQVTFIPPENLSPGMVYWNICVVYRTDIVNTQDDHNYGDRQYEDWIRTDLSHWNSLPPWRTTQTHQRRSSSTPFTQIDGKETNKQSERETRARERREERLNLLEDERSRSKTSGDEALTARRETQGSQGGWWSGTDKTEWKEDDQKETRKRGRDTNYKTQ